MATGRVTSQTKLYKVLVKWHRSMAKGGAGGACRWAVNEDHVRCRGTYDSLQAR